MGAADEQRCRKLKWLCRRGMKELDILLEHFLARRGAELRSGLWPELEALLDTEDDLLWDWVQHPATPAAEPFRALLEDIRSDRG